MKQISYIPLSDIRLSEDGIEDLNQSSNITFGDATHSKGMFTDISRGVPKTVFRFLLRDIESWDIEIMSLDQKAAKGPF